MLAFAHIPTGTTTTGRFRFECRKEGGSLRSCSSRYAADRHSGTRRDSLLTPSHRCPNSGVHLTSSRHWIGVSNGRSWDSRDRRFECLNFATRGIYLRAEVVSAGQSPKPNRRKLKQRKEAAEPLNTASIFCLWLDLNTGIAQTAPLLWLFLLCLYLSLFMAEGGGFEPPIGV